MTQINAFVPLKGHSARVPGKNLRPFDGRPLFHAVIRSLQRAARIGVVTIDTDSDAIAASAESLGVRILRRPDHLVGDDVPVNALIQHYFDVTGDEAVLQTHATNPLLQPATIDDAVDLFFSHPNATSLFSVNRIQSRLYDANWQPINHDPAELIPTQRLPPVYEENSNIYITTPAAMAERGTRISSDFIVFEMDHLEAIDIDEESDLHLAQAVLDFKRRQVE